MLKEQPTAMGEVTLSDIQDSYSINQIASMLSLHYMTVRDGCVMASCKATNSDGAGMCCGGISMRLSISVQGVSNATKSIYKS